MDSAFASLRRDSHSDSELTCTSFGKFGRNGSSLNGNPCPPEALFAGGGEPVFQTCRRIERGLVRWTPPSLRSGGILIPTANLPALRLVSSVGMEVALTGIPVRRRRF